MHARLQDVTLPAKGKSARAPALSTHEWKEAYRGLALSCQARMLRPLQIRLCVFAGS